MIPPTAQEVHALRIEAIRSLSAAMNGDNASVLDAINAICDYGSARQAWHNANSDPGDPPIWSDAWKELMRR